MADVLTPKQRHLNMAAIHSSSTKPELKLRHALWRLGFRYRINVRHLPGKPDIVLSKYHTAVFVHGCFWHSHKNCKDYAIPKTNTEYWIAKVDRNQERDQVVWRQLEAKGWFVIIVWECQLKKAVFNDTVNRVAAEIVKNGSKYQSLQEERRLSRKKYLKERRVQQKRRSILMQEIKDKL